MNNTDLIIQNQQQLIELVTEVRDLLRGELVASESSGSPLGILIALGVVILGFCLAIIAAYICALINRNNNDTSNKCPGGYGSV